jgi:hypothetical protein
MKMLAPILIAFCMFGCQSDVKKNAQTTSANLTSIEAHADSALNNIGIAEPHTGLAGKGPLKAASQNVTTIKVKAKEATKSHAEEVRGYGELRDKYNKLHNSLAVRIQRYLTYIAIAWGVLGVIGVALKVFVPFGGAFTAGRSILQFLPFANPFSLVADFFNRKKVVTVIEPATVEK